MNPSLEKMIASGNSSFRCWSKWDIWNFNSSFCSKTLFSNSKPDVHVRYIFKFWIGLNKHNQYFFFLFYCVRMILWKYH